MFFLRVLPSSVVGTVQKKIKTIGEPEMNKKLSIGPRKKVPEAKIFLLGVKRSQKQ